MNLIALLLSVNLNSVSHPLPFKPNDYCLWEPNKGVTAVVSGPVILISTDEASTTIVFKCEDNIPYKYARIAFKLEAERNQK